VVADTLGSVGVILSSILIERFGLYIADPVCSLFIATMIFLSVLPLLKESSLVLLQRTPVDIEKALSNVLNKVNRTLHQALASAFESNDVMVVVL
jgi:zinc transporter 5/7